MSYYKLTVVNAEVYTFDDDTEGYDNHAYNTGVFTLGHFETIDLAKAELEEFFDSTPDYEAYEDDNYLICDRLEDKDGNKDKDGDYLGMYTVCLEKITAVSFSSKCKGE